MKRSLSVIALSLIAAAALAQAPQKVASLDVAHAKVRGTLPRGLKCAEAASHPEGNLALTVAPLAKKEYAPGETIVYTVRIENVGAKPFSIPWSPDPGVLPRQRELDRYVVSAFRVGAYTECGAANLPETDLYGDPSAPKSWLELKPREYAEVTLATRVYGLAACKDNAPTPVQLRVTMAQSAPARRKDDTCVVSFFKGYHADKPVEITLVPAAPPLKKASAK